MKLRFCEFLLSVPIPGGGITHAVDAERHRVPMEVVSKDGLTFVSIGENLHPWHQVKMVREWRAPVVEMPKKGKAKADEGAV